LVGARFMGREQPAPGRCLAHTGLANSVAGMAKKRRTILPLPKGEGRGFGPELSRTGEGNENVAHPTVR
jgi:hypothetical protein